MPRVYELPTHLQVEDQLIGALSARQSLQLGIGVSLAYAAWDQLRWLPSEFRWTLAVMVSVVTLVFALVRPFGRPLDQWLVAGLLFFIRPRRLVWRPAAADLRQPSPERPAWAELELRPEWLDTEYPREREQSVPPRALRQRFMWRLRWMWRNP